MFNGEFAAFDPNPRCIFHAVEDNGSGVSRGYDDPWIVWRRAGACTGLQSSVEEHVEVLEISCWTKNFGHVKPVKIDEGLDFTGRSRIVVFPALLKAQRSQELPN